MLTASFLALSALAQAAAHSVPQTRPQDPLAFAGSLGQQAQPGRAVENKQWTFDVTFVGLKVGYARRIGQSRFAGVGFGLGGDYALNAMVLAGRHFAQDGWAAYADRDQYGGERLMELLQVDLFLRTDRGGRWQWDAGLHASDFAHWDDSDDELGSGTFVGGYLAPMWGTRHVKFGPRVLAGFFSEGQPEFGINVSLLTGRILLTR